MTSDPGRAGPDRGAGRRPAATAGRAPSLHNSQPWRFRVTARVIELYADPERTLPVADPDGREQRMACGAALFNLRLALHGHRIRPTVTILPDRARPELLAVDPPRRHEGTHAGADAAAARHPGAADRPAPVRRRGGGPARAARPAPGRARRRGLAAHRARPCRSGRRCGPWCCGRTASRRPTRTPADSSVELRRPSGRVSAGRRSAGAATLGHARLHRRHRPPGTGKDSRRSR